ncbi:MAG: aminotransferase class III [Candidatus Fluviicola riflensis]|nr:MAG: aspartate aminotransferase family protein [Candidatus Fluviicola riflensis]OGS80086.1 MAG: aminotransferase class III [Candidatus Fluviicola riflensis]OGS87258.1 MAG: aminotransferase class III [Fluviicola sp. RIFCSPHIGHO2_01_FULL_43_53]OGS90015.1 MAG: aminotransferase class III [Fluviicola sp. RIFCSPHIGHO2_12_FULL_43_24]
MTENKHDFLYLLGQTNPFPYLIEVAKAEGIFIYDKTGKRYADMIAGVAVNNIGHRHPLVIQRLQEQLEKYLHVMVYGEFIQDTSVEMARALTRVLPDSLNCVYPVNSGTEANEAALKLAKRVTGRTQLIGCKGSYHGNTHGSMSVSSNEAKKIAFRPLLPDVDFIRHNEIADLSRITERTAAVIIEPIQGDAGVRQASTEYLKALRQRCDEVGSFLIFDEIQCGMGRSGKLFAFEHSGVVPDVLTLGKALGGGMPIGAFVARYEHMQELTHQPMLGHITTFGGHPVIAAAAWATLEVFATEIDFDLVEENGLLLENMLSEIDEINEIRRVGMMFACDMESFERVEKVVNRCLELGLISFWFLSHPYSFRLSPPLTISREEIEEAGRVIQRAVRETK